VLDFLSLSQITERNSLKEERFILSLEFSRFSSWFTDSITLSLLQSRSIIAEKHGGGQLLTSLWPTSKERENREEEAGVKIYP
jgi:hypothetical protein